MSATWTKSAVFVACAALISMAVVPALAQPEEMQSQSPPAEIQEMPQTERQSKPRETDAAERALQLRQRVARGICISSEDTEAEAVDYCTPKLNCQPPKKTKCMRRQNFQDWRCTCK